MGHIESIDIPCVLENVLVNVAFNGGVRTTEKKSESIDKKRDHVRQRGNALFQVVNKVMRIKESNH